MNNYLLFVSIFELLVIIWLSIDNYKMYCELRNYGKKDA
jgi:hypothetical protein